MKDAEKSKEQLINELVELRQYVAALDATETERKRAEDSIRESEEKYRSLFEHANDSIFIIDPSTRRFIDFNEKASTRLGYTRKELLHLTIEDIATPMAAQRNDAIIQELLETGSVIFEHAHLRKDGTKMSVEISSRFIEYGGQQVFQSILRDITERKRTEQALHASHRFLEIANRHMEMIPLLNEFVSEVKELTTCEAAGIRILDEDGNIPYEAFNGFSQAFYELECPLSITADQCMCINVIKGTTDPNLPFYTEGGSFYINSTTHFLATVSEEEKGQTRDRCNEFGYESVALVPIRLGGRILGLIHIADCQEDILPLELVEVLEWAAMQLGTAIKQVEAREALRKAHDELEQRVKERTSELVQANEQLKREIEERRLTEQAIRKAEEKYRLLVQNLPSVVYKGYEDWSVEFFDKKIKSLMGYSVDDFHSQRMKWCDLIVEEDLEAVREEFIRALKTDKSYIREYRTKTEAGDILWIQDRGQIICNKEGEIEYVSGVFFDITDRMKADEALRKSEQELRLLSSQLLTAQENERKRIARELHDGIGQSLSAIKFKVEDALRQMAEGSANSTVNSMSSLIPMIQRAVEEVRRITMDLRPSTLDDLGLIATIGWFSREFQETYSDIRIEREINIEENEVPEPLKIVIYRVLQEAVNNVAKHSEANLIGVRLSKTDGKIELAVEDNGRGFEVEEALSVESSERGFGLGSMRERTEFTGGSLSIKAAKGAGTVVRASWPSEEVEPG
jgi:PAS domain S-box-containing protein